MNQYISIPIDFQELISSKTIQKVDLFTSIRQHIYLILLTPTDDYAFNGSYGNKIWYQDYDLAVYDEKWTQMVENEIKETIHKNEQRIYPETIVKLKVSSTEDAEQTKLSFLIEISKIRTKATNQTLPDIVMKLTTNPLTLA